MNKKLCDVIRMMLVISILILPVTVAGMSFTPAPSTDYSKNFINRFSTITEDQIVKTRMRHPNLYDTVMTLIEMETN